MIRWKLNGTKVPYDYEVLEAMKIVAKMDGENKGIGISDGKAIAMQEEGGLYFFRADEFSGGGIFADDDEDTLKNKTACLLDGLFDAIELIDEWKEWEQYDDEDEEDDDGE